MENKKYTKMDALNALYCQEAFEQAALEAMEEQGLIELCCGIVCIPPKAAPSMQAAFAAFANDDV